MGFEPQIRGIVADLPAAANGRQTVFFTATWPTEVQALARDFLNSPVQINVGDNAILNANKDITQHIEVLKEFEKEAALLKILEQHDGEKGIVFISRRADCDDLADILRERISS